MQLKKIKVYGKLRQFLGKSYFEAAVRSPQQAVNFLMANFEGLQKHMNDQIYKIKMGGRVITEDYLSMTGQGDIQIIPIATGGLNFAVGLLFSGFAAEVGAFAAGVLGSQLIGTGITAILSTVGTSMIIGGVTEMLSPTAPSRDPSSGMDEFDPAALASNYSFTGLTNISRAGVPVNLVFGEILTGSITISNGVDTVQVEGSNE